MEAIQPLIVIGVDAAGNIALQVRTELPNAIFLLEKVKQTLLAKDNEAAQRLIVPAVPVLRPNGRG